jgi:hypothetical protein
MNPDDYCDCDCIVYGDVDGRAVQLHHRWPDDDAPHTESPECGCRPQLHQVDDTLYVYEHADQG